jgi:plasmid stabilization system protein ParE
MRLRFYPFVKNDLAEISEYISNDSPSPCCELDSCAAVEYCEIAKYPMLFRIRPELGADARLASVGNYAILFRIRGQEVRIERVVHASRDLVPLIEETEQ